jgi:hypothetical protein
MMLPCRQGPVHQGQYLRRGRLRPRAAQPAQPPGEHSAYGQCPERELQSSVPELGNVVPAYVSRIGVGRPVIIAGTFLPGCAGACRRSPTVKMSPLLEPSIMARPHLGRRSTIDGGIFPPTHSLCPDSPRSLRGKSCWEMPRPVRRPPGGLRRPPRGEERWISSGGEAKDK